MLRRPQTTLTITAEDVADYEDRRNAERVAFVKKINDAIARQSHSHFHHSSPNLQRTQCPVAQTGHSRLDNPTIKTQLVSREQSYPTAKQQTRRRDLRTFGTLTSDGSSGDPSSSKKSKISLSPEFADHGEDVRGSANTAMRPTHPPQDGSCTDTSR